MKYIEENIENFNTRLILRGYLEQMVEKTLREVKYKDRKEALKQKLKIVEGTTTLCFGQFHSTVNTKLWKCGIITHKWHFLIEILRDIFKELPLICYRKGKSLKYVLVKAKQRL